MRIGVIGAMVPDSVAENVVLAADSLGHTGIALGPTRPAAFGRSSHVAMVADVALRSVAIETSVQRRLFRDVNRHQLDLLVVVNAYLVPEVANQLKLAARKMVYWFPDAVVNLGRQSMIQADYDAVFSKEPWLVRNITDFLGQPWYFLPEACSTRWHQPPPDAAASEVDPCIVVAGNFYPYRIRLLERLVRANVPLKVYGNPLPRWMPSDLLAPLHAGRYLAHDDKARVYRSSAAVLNAVHPSEVEGLSMRLFEAAGCGACVLTEPKAALADCFEPGSEVLTYGDFDELVDRARWVIDHPHEARAIGDRAAERAHRDHTYEHRLQTVLDTVGLA